MFLKIRILFIDLFFDYTQLIIEHLKNKAYVHFVNEKE